MNWRRVPLALCAAIFATYLVAGVAVSQEESAPTIEELRRAYAGAPETWPRPTLREGAHFVEFGPTPAQASPAHNPTTRARITLGERLFNEPRLSGSGQIACASCHNSELGLSDGVSTSFGHNRQRGRRNSISLVAVGWAPELFWDGRSASLEEQMIIPLINPIEMAGDPDAAVAMLVADPTYVRDFSVAFGDRPISIERVADALAAFQRSLRPRPSRWDRALRDGADALNDQQLRGLHLFRTKAGCANCHNGPFFTDFRFHNIGLSFYGRSLEDLGRYHVTQDPADVGAFRTPSLRGVARSAPYMHNGGFPHLRGVVNMYNAGGVHPRRSETQQGDPLFPTTTPILQPLNLTREERDALVAFLETL